MGAAAEKADDKYPQLKPKVVDLVTRMEQYASSKVGPVRSVTLSKKWTLPPKVKPGRKPGSLNLDGETAEAKKLTVDTVDHTHVGFGAGELDLCARRKRQNREAQRAYRARKANQISELERLCADWEAKYSKLKDELNFQRSRYIKAEQDHKIKVKQLTAVNNDLQERIEKLVETVQARQASNDDLNILSLCTSTNNLVASGDSKGITKGKMHFKNTDLQVKIEQFQPMKAVPLNRAKRSESELLPTHLPVFKRVQSTVRPNQTVLQWPSPNNEGDASKPCGAMCAEFTLACDFSLDEPPFEANDLKSLTTGTGVFDSQGKEIMRCTICGETQDPCLPSGSVISVGELDTALNLPSQSTAACSTRCSESAKNTPTATLPLPSNTTPSLLAKKKSTFVPGSCGQCQRDPNSKKFCQALCRVSAAAKDDENSITITQQDSPSSGEYIHISDAFKRIKQHMKHVPSNNKLMLHKLNVRGTQVELKSVDDMIRQMDRNLYK